MIRATRSRPNGSFRRLQCAQSSLSAGSSPARRKLSAVANAQLSMFRRRKSATSFPPLGLFAACEQESIALRLMLDVAEVRVDRRFEPCAAARSCGRALQRLLELVDVPLGECIVQSFLVAEMSVENRFCDSCLCRDVFHRDVRAETAHGAIGRVEELLSASLLLARSLGVGRCRHVRNLAPESEDGEQLRTSQTAHDRRSQTAEQSGDAAGHEHHDQDQDHAEDDGRGLLRELDGDQRRDPGRRSAGTPGAARRR